MNKTRRRCGANFRTSDTRAIVKRVKAEKDCQNHEDKNAFCVCNLRIVENEKPEAHEFEREKKREEHAEVITRAEHFVDIRILLIRREIDEYAQNREQPSSALIDLACDPWRMLVVAHVLDLA